MAQQSNALCLVDVVKIHLGIPQLDSLSVILSHFYIKCNIVSFDRHIRTKLELFVYLLDITYPWDGAQSKFRTWRFFVFTWLCCCWGNLCFTNPSCLSPAKFFCDWVGCVCAWNMIQNEPFCVSSSLADMLSIKKGFGGQRSRSRWTNTDITL